MFEPDFGMLREVVILFHNDDSSTFSFLTSTHMLVYLNVFHRGS